MPSICFRCGVPEVWHDREMLPGDTVDEEIAQKLRTADLVLVLVSPSFINSEYCWDIELKNAIERHERGEARVVPVVLRPCQWQLTPLKNLLAMPTDGRAVTNWPDRDTAFNDVARGIAKLATAMRQKGSKEADPAAAGAKPVASQGSPGPPSPLHPGPLPRAGEGDSADAAGTPRPPAGEGGTRDSGRVRGGARVDPRDLPDFAVFRDVDEPWCPEMVVIPAGSFLMGSPPSEPERSKYEGPHHRVTIDYRFAIGRYAVTFEEYDHFCEETNREKPADQGWGRSRQPAINVSWQDAMAFCGWLGKETGKPYRLPSEAEWEYACRAATTTAFSFGETVTPSQVNYDGNYTYAGSAKGVYRMRTVEVGGLPANPWGLHEMHGNAWEWVEDV